ncbi:M17 family peptidase N-terminal domain-containing protein [Methylomonas sp. AM2-LC]|uniref:M17 family peptidase N-terminal domain-containing protein n=1 Tax=Methylomonas sp. AM2-LC TaxID=3153301 RepID=UPI00326759DC
MTTLPSITIKSLIFSFSILSVSSVWAVETPEKIFQASHGLKVSIKEIGPVTQTADLQIITLLKHHSDGDKYIEAMQDFNDKQGGLVAALRERGEFIGELGETLLYTPPKHSIKPKKVLLIGLGDEQDLSLEKLRVAGRIAVREAVRLQAKNVSFAPTLRDQGSSLIEVGEGDAAVVEQVLLAYDTEKHLQKLGLTPKFSIASWVIEAGPSYFESANTHIDAIIQQTTEQLKKRDTQSYLK